MPKSITTRQQLISTIILLAVALVCVVFLASTHWLASLGSHAEGKRLERIRRSPRFRGEQFANTTVTSTMREGQYWSAMREFLFNDEETRPRSPIPVFTDTLARLRTPPSSGLRLTWLGHSTVIVEIDGHRVLTDPVWSERASPSTIMGPVRFAPPPIDLVDVGRLDAVLLSHDHYDHLDMHTVRALAERDVPFYAPLAVGAHLEHWGVAPALIHELDWWESAKLKGGLSITAAPAQHFSGRALFDKNHTLWASWVIVGGEHRVFFSGDTGLTPELEEIGKRFGPFDVALLEIGAFHEAWGDIHLGPQNALAAYRAVQAKALLPVHWATFDLAAHAWYQPAETLFVGAQKAGVRLLLPRLGEPLEPERDAPNKPWWRRVEAVR